MERGAQAGGEGAAEPGGDPVAQLLGGLAGEREGEDLVGRDALLDAGDHGLDQRGGLAGAGAGQHQERAVAVVDDRPLLLVEHGHRDGGVRSEKTVGGAAHRTSQPPGSDTGADTAGRTGGRGPGSPPSHARRLSHALRVTAG